MTHELEDERVLGQLLELLTLVEQGPHPLVGAALVDVVGAAGDLGCRLLDQPASHGRQLLGRQAPFDQAVAVLVEIGRRLLQIGREHRCHGLIVPTGPSLPPCA